MKENKSLLEFNQDFWFSTADNPFRTYKVISGLVRGNESNILSSFGPKPISLGFCLAGIKHNLKYCMFKQLITILTSQLVMTRLLRIGSNIKETSGGIKYTIRDK